MINANPITGRSPHGATPWVIWQTVDLIVLSILQMSTLVRRTLSMLVVCSVAVEVLIATTGLSAGAVGDNHWEARADGECSDRRERRGHVDQLYVWTQLLRSRHVESESSPKSRPRPVFGTTRRSTFDRALQRVEVDHGQRRGLRCHDERHLMHVEAILPWPWEEPTAEHRCPTSFVDMTGIRFGCRTQRFSLATGISWIPSPVPHPPTASPSEQISGGKPEAEPSINRYSKCSMVRHGPSRACQRTGMAP